MGIDTGNTAWLFISTALVLLMTPGLALFYSGLVATRNVINTINMSFICLGIVPILWALVGYSLVFSLGNPWIGGLEWFGLKNVGMNTIQGQTVPQYAYMLFQMMFAVIAPALISGAIVGRMKFKPYVFFIILWVLFVYIPIAHWVWGPDGWLATQGAIDFAGGTVVHINAGFAALTATIILGPRVNLKQEKHETPHNIPFVILGCSLLWFGWFGFNAGSAINANGIASLAMVTTVLAPAASICIWTILTWLRGHPSAAVGKACATVVGLVAITPAAGYVTPLGAIVIGSVGAITCYFATAYKSQILRRVDDPLDVFICHGLAGVVGSLMTGILASHAINSHAPNGLLYGNPHQLTEQVIAISATIIVSMVGTAIILYLLKFIMRIHFKPEEKKNGIDMLEHGESAYTELT